MKLTSYIRNRKIYLGAIKDNIVFDLHSLDNRIADNMQDFLIGGDEQLLMANSVLENKTSELSISNVKIISPVPNPPSDRDA